MKTSSWKKEEINAIAEEILALLKLKLNIVCSWGFNKAQATVYNDMPGLKFCVNEFFHKGHVMILLNAGADLYEIFILNLDGSIKEHITDVFFEDVHDIIDEAVEKGKLSQEEYEEKIGDFLKQAL